MGRIAWVIWAYIYIFGFKKIRLSTTHPKFDLIRFRTYDLEIMTVHFMPLIMRHTSQSLNHHPPTLFQPSCYPPHPLPTLMPPTLSQPSCHPLPTLMPPTPRSTSDSSNSSACDRAVVNKCVKISLMNYCPCLWMHSWVTAAIMYILY